MIGPTHACPECGEYIFQALTSEGLQEFDASLTLGGGWMIDPAERMLVPADGDPNELGYNVHIHMEEPYAPEPPGTSSE